jgi:hypothetical protein
MPNYRITIKMKMGNDKTGIRFFPSYYIDHVRFLVREQVKNSIGMFPVSEILVEMIPDKGYEPTERRPEPDFTD